MKDYKNYKYTKFAGVYSTTLDFWEQPKDYTHERAEILRVIVLILGIIGLIIAIQ